MQKTDKGTAAKLLQQHSWLTNFTLHSIVQVKVHSYHSCDSYGSPTLLHVYHAKLDGHAVTGLATLEPSVMNWLDTLARTEQLHVLIV